MSAIFGCTVQTTVGKNEKDLISYLISYLTGLDSRITCSSDIDTEYDTSVSTHIPIFNFSIDGTVSFSIKRDAQISSNSESFYGICNGTTSGKMLTMPDQWSRAWSATDQIRGFTVSNIITDDLILLSIAGITTRGLSGSINIVYIKTPSKYYTSIAANLSWNKETIFSISSRTLTESGTGVQGILLSRFSYACPPGHIDYIKNAVYSNNGSKLSNITTLYDCTTVTIGDTISLEDGVYIAVGPHQLVKIGTS